MERVKELLDVVKIGAFAYDADMGEGAAKRVAVYGGAFDPPHVGHMFVITALFNSGAIDEVWLAPVGDDRYDRKVNVSAWHRRQMLELLSQEYGILSWKMEIETAQLDGVLPGSATIDLLDYLKRSYPKHDFYFVMGADNLAAVPGWREYERLAREAKFIVVERLGIELPEKMPTSMQIVRATSGCATDVSSTLIREHIRGGRTITGLVPAAIVDYINNHELYQEVKSAGEGNVTTTYRWIGAGIVVLILLAAVAVLFY